MAKKDNPPKELMERISNAVRNVGEQSALTREMIGGHFALQRTDRAGLDFLYSRGGACSAGELSKATGLTSGSTTALIDRLEKAGYAAREPEPDDRRKQIVRIPERVFARCEQVYAPIRAEMFKLWSSYSVEDLELVEEFLTRSTQLHADCVERFRRHGSDASKHNRHLSSKKRRRP